MASIQTDPGDHILVTGTRGNPARE